MPTSALPPVLLSSTSVYPESTESSFEVAAKLGFDGIELMVGIDPVAANVDAVLKLSSYHGVPVGSVHAPVLLITPNTWGNDPWEKLKRSADAANRLGATTIVVHPPFRWQKDYASGFVRGIRALEASEGVIFAVENMYPWRTPVGSVQAYLPDWDPTDVDYDHLTLDLSHASTAQRQALDYLRAWGTRLAHVHLTDGSGSLKDEHLFPGLGDQQAWHVVTELGRSRFTGQIAIEVNSRRADSKQHREQMLQKCLADTRAYLREGREAARLAP